MTLCAKTGIYNVNGVIPARVAALVHTKRDPHELQTLGRTVRLNDASSAKRCAGMVVQPHVVTSRLA